MLMTSLVSNFFKKRSISNEYFFIFSCIISVIIFLSIWYSWTVYDSRKAIKEQELFRYSTKISSNLTETFDYVENLLKFVGEQIIKNDSKDLNEISALLQGRLIKNNDIREQFSWLMFDWSTPDKKMIVSTSWGVMESPKDISYRNYAQQAFNEPWKIHFDKVDVGISSGKLVIPAGMGITSKSEEPLGIVSLGFGTEKLVSRLENLMNANSISFILLDKDKNIAIKSTDNNLSKEDENFLKNHLKINMMSGNNSYQLLPEKIKIGNIIYSNYINIEKYPYTLLVGNNENIAYQELKETLLPGVIGYSIIGLVSLSLLFLLRFLIIKPLINISHSADQISKGNYSVKIPRGGPSEIYALAKQLVNVQRYIKKIHRIDKQLMKAKDAAEEANAAKSQFLASMSHELRTPLNSILGYSEMITHEVMGKIENKTYIEYAGYAHSSGQMLLALINDILDISKAEAGHFSIYETEFSIRKVIDESMEILSQQALAANVHIELMLPERMPTLLADEIRIKQVILNIMSNAIKFSHKGGKVEMKVDVSNSGFNLTVRDYGIGISEEYLGKVLEKFGQVNQAMQRRRNEGSGLGLWLTKILLESHQGTITLESTVGKGTTIFVHLPVERIKKY